MTPEDHLKKDGSFKKQYKLLKEIGQGAFGKVHLVENRKGKKQYAVKVIETKSANELKDARQEIRIFKDLEHPHIVHYKDDFEVRNGVIVVMEYCENGDLQKRIASRNPSLDFYPESQVVEWATQICKALQYLHSNNILHRDLKPANIFLATRDVIKLGDFGVARKLADVVDVAMTVCGTPLYISPEIVQQKPYNHKSDVWSAGCCIYEIMTLNPAIDPIPVRISQQWNVRPMPLNYSAELCDAIKSMLSIDCTDRPPIGDILQKLLCILTTAQGSPTAQLPPTPPQRPSSAQLPPTIPERPSPAQLPPTPAQRHSSAQIFPTAQGTRAAAFADEAKPRRSSLDVANRATRTLDVVRTTNKHSVSLDSGAGVDEDVDSIAADRGGQMSRSTWYSDAKPSDDEFWTISDSSIVDKLTSLGVSFNHHGQLIQLSTGSRFQFDFFPNDKASNQLRYEEIGDQMTDYVYNLLETKLHMKRRWLPVDASDEPRSFIFVTDDYKTNDKKLLVLVHGPGVPRAGQWARKVIMNDSLAAGTQIPWIQQAVEEGYAVVVLNPNLNNHEVTGTPIRENEDGASHALYVWDKVISTEVKATKIAFAAHSAGANIVLKLATEREKEFSDRVVGIALADYCLDDGANRQSSIKSLFAKRARNWASSDKPLDTALTSDRNSIPKYSAGETRLDWTPGACIPSALRFLNKRYKKN